MDTQAKDLKTLNNDLLENVVASVELFITNNPFDANTAQKAKDLLDLIWRKCCFR